MEKARVGRISHYFPKIGVAVIEVEAALKVGDKILVEGSTAFEQTIDSMQVDRKPIKAAKKGDSVGMKTAQPVKEHDIVYKM
jgi:translation elongation factor EF-1alpha